MLVKKGLLIIISGPSGVGKGTVRNYFMNDESLKLVYSISMTTRSPRAGEQDGVDYIFSTREEFEKAIQNGELLEWAEFVGNYYGTPIAQVENFVKKGKMFFWKSKCRVQHRLEKNVRMQYQFSLFHQAWKSWKIAFAVEEANRKKLCSSV